MTKRVDLWDISEVNIYKAIISSLIFNTVHTSSMCWAYFKYVLDIQFNFYALKIFLLLGFILTYFLLLMKKE